MKPKFSQRVLENTQIKKFHDNHSSGGWFFPCGQTEDKDGEANNDSSQFCERA